MPDVTFARINVMPTEPMEKKAFAIWMTEYI